MIEARVMEQLVAEWATATEWGLEVVKARQAEIEVRLWKSLVDTEVALQKSLETLESEKSALVSEQNALKLFWKALESERKAQSEADQKVLGL